LAIRGYIEIPSGGLSLFRATISLLEIQEVEEFWSRGYFLHEVESTDCLCCWEKQPLSELLGLQEEEIAGFVPW
jgi:hypothetical protein